MSSQRELVMSALQKLDDSQVERMLTAFHGDERVGVGGWWDCLWACAYGPRGTLVADHGFDTTICEGDEMVPVRAVTPEIVANLFDVTPEEVTAVTRAYDGAETTEVFRWELRALLGERLRKGRSAQTLTGAAA